MQRFARLFELVTVLSLIALPAAVAYRLVTVPPVPANAAQLFPEHRVAEAIGWAELIAALSCSGIAICLLAWTLLTLRRLFAAFRRGEALTEPTARLVRRTGFGLFLLALAGVLLGLAHSLLLSISGPPGTRTLSLSIGSAELGFLIAGGVMTLVGWAMADAARIAEENRGFV